MIIHISGPSGSGKTTLGNKLKKKFGNKITVKDLDDLRDEFINSYYGKKRWTYINVNKYQKYINDFIKNHNKKPLIFVGLNDNTRFGKNKKLYYKLKSDYNFYIKIDNSIIIEQKCERFINVFLPAILKDHKKDITQNNEFFVKNVINGFKHECSAKKTIQMNNKWNKDYKKQKYKFMTRENIYKKTCQLISKSLKK